MHLWAAYDNDDNKYNKNKFALISSHFIKTRKSLMIRCFQNSNQWRCNVIQILINKWIRCFQITVEPVYNGHPRDLSNWPLNTGGRLRVIVRENRAVPKDWGQPISFIFSALRTKLIRLTLVTLTRFPGFSLSRLTTPLVFGQGKP